MKKGGVGNWEKMSDAAEPQVPDADIKTMVRTLKLKKEPASSGRLGRKRGPLCSSERDARLTRPPARYPSLRPAVRERAT